MSKKDKQMKSVLELNRSRGDHIAVFLTHTFGSMKFLCLSLVLFLVWITWNLNFLPGLKPFDPYPFTMLIMIVTLFSIILTAMPSAKGLSYKAVSLSGSSMKAAEKGDLLKN